MGFQDTRALVPTEALLTRSCEKRNTSTIIISLWGSELQVQKWNWNHQFVVIEQLRSCSAVENILESEGR